MIALFRKLQQEKLLKENGTLLDLGCGNGKISEPFFQFGYDVTLVDKDMEILKEAEKNLSVIKKGGLRAINLQIEEFKFEGNYDGIILSNTLPFQSNMENIEKIVTSAFKSLNSNGFLFFTLFGEKDQWNLAKKEGMTFCEKDAAISILKEEPYYQSEDYGQGTTMKGNLKTWHIFSFLYIKR